MTVTSGENTEAAALAQTLTQNAPASGSQSEPSVPVHVIQSMRDELRQEKEKREALENHFRMMQWNQQQAPQPTPQFNPFQGRDPKDSILVEDASRVFTDFATQIRNEVRSEIAEVKVASRSSDYKEVINKYLPKAAQEDPDLINEIKNSANPYKTAYLAAKASQAYQDDYAASKASKQAPAAPSRASETERIVANAKQSGNLASVGNQANISDNYKQYSRMTDEEFLKHKNSLKFRTAGSTR